MYTFWYVYILFCIKNYYNFYLVFAFCKNVLNIFSHCHYDIFNIIFYFQCFVSFAFYFVFAVWHFSSPILELGTGRVTYKSSFVFLMVFPGGSGGIESTCNVGDLGLIPGLGRSPGEGKGYPLQYSAWRIPWTVWPMASQRVGHDWRTLTLPSSWLCLMFWFTGQSILVLRGCVSSFLHGFWS